MKKTIISIYILQIFLLLSCTQKNIKPVISLKRAAELNQLTDSTNLLDVRSVFFYKDYLLLSDYKRNQIFILDKKLNLLKTIGQAGRGPGEFTGVEQIYICGDTIYAQNDGNKSIETYSIKGDYINTLYMKNGISFSGESRFFVKNNSIYLPSVDNKGINSILIHNLETQENLSFGNTKKYRSNKETIIKNNKHLLTYGDLNISIANNRPEIELYDEYNKLIRRFNFSDNRLLNETMKFAEEHSKEENSYFVMIPDACIYQNKIYLLLTTCDNKSNVSSNKVVEIALKARNFNLTRILNLGDGWYETLSTNSENLISFNRSEYKLVKYNLN